MSVEKRRRQAYSTNAMPDSLRSAIAAAQPPPESTAFNHEVERVDTSKSARISARVDPQIAAEAERVIKAAGFSVQYVLRSFFTTIARTGRLPFNDRITPIGREIAEYDAPLPRVKRRKK